jgi:benzoyl-CoA reductase/2-hydroxyglutaryl-CoA dehydratase subunit BcrC/BadD/HgdB
VLCSTPVNELWLYNFLLSLGLRGEAGIFPAVSLLNLSHEGRPSAERFNIQALRDLAGTLGIAAAALNDRIVARNQVRAWLRRIDAQRRSPVAGMSGTDARRLMDPADSLRSEHYLAWAAAQPEPAAQRGLPVIYSSPRVPSLELYEALEARGLRIVGDDTDAGSRAIGPDVSEQGDPLEALARRYAARAPAPAGWSTSARVDFVLDMARLRGAKAILFDLPAWSHPAAWDYPAERGVLEASGIVCVELSCGSPTDSAEAAFTHLAGLIRTEAHHG